MDTENTYKFIEIVQEEDILWNIISKGYKDVYRRNKLWKEIGSKFGITGEEAYKYFRKLREKYRREMQKEERASRSGAGYSKGSNWIFKKHLDFLNTAMKSRSVKSSAEWLHTNEPELNSEYLEEYHIKSVDICQDDSTTSTSVLPSPSLERPKPVKTKTSEKSLEEVKNANTQQLISALNGDGNPFDGVLEFLKETLKQQDEIACKMLEKELLDIAMKYRYSNI